MKLPNFNFSKRSFISLVITPRQLKVVKLNTKTNTIVKFAELTIPPGVIVNYRVKDKETLIKLIREIWAKNGFREKYVGVVVPEFSTYTKSFDLPNLTDTELSEAISWKMQEYLPTGLDEVIFDWKIIKREKEKAHVLVVAILKDVLFGYIDAVGSSGLSPLVVETPSLSLQRMVEKDDVGKLIIYVNGNEAILVVSTGIEIVASSVVTTDNFNVIVTTAQQLLTHYSTVNIQKVIISGVGLTQDLVQFLNYNLGRSVAFADIKVKGLLPGQIQDFLIGLSLQYKDPAEPASESTINLLPPEWAEYYKKQSSGIRTWTLTLMASIIIWSTFLYVLLVFMFLSIQLETMKTSESQAKTQELNEAVATVNAANALADSVIKTDENLVYPQEIINLLTSTKTEGITLSSYIVNFESGEIILAGNAQTRANLLTFKNSLETKEELDSVNLPIASLIQETNINFEVTMYYKKFVVVVQKPVKLKAN